LSRNLHLLLAGRFVLRLLSGNGRTQTHNQSEHRARRPGYAPPNRAQTNWTVFGNDGSVRPAIEPGANSSLSICDQRRGLFVRHLSDVVDMEIAEIAKANAFVTSHLFPGGGTG